MYKEIIFISLVVSLAAVIGCAGMSVADLSSINEDTVDSVPFVGTVSAQSAEPIADGCMGVKTSVLAKIPKNEKGAKAVSTVCGHINREPCNKEDACVERCKEACKQDALSKVL